MTAFPRGVKMVTRHESLERRLNCESGSLIGADQAAFTLAKVKCRVRRIINGDSPL